MSYDEPFARFQNQNCLRDREEMLSKSEFRIVILIIECDNQIRDRQLLGLQVCNAKCK